MKFIRTWAALLALACFSLAPLGLPASAQDVAQNITATGTWVDLTVAFPSLANQLVYVADRSPQVVTVVFSNSATAPAGGGVPIIGPYGEVLNSAAHIWVQSTGANLATLSAGIQNGPSGSSLAGWTPGGTFATLSTSSTSSNVALPAGTTDVVWNIGSSTAYLNLGTSNSVTAATTEIPLAAGGWLQITPGSNTYLAAITSSSTTTLTIAGGAGLPTGALAGSGGGSSGAVTQSTGNSATPWYFLPSVTNPIALISATPFNALAYASVTISCTVAPSAGTVVGSPDNSADYVTLTAVLNNSAGYSTTTTVSATGLYSVPGHQYIEVTGLTGGTCFIAGGQ